MEIQNPTNINRKEHLQEERVLSFTQVLEEEPFILTDSTLFLEKNDSSWYQKDVYFCHAYSRLNCSLLERVLSSLENAQELLRKPNVSTVSKVVDEIARAKNMIQHKQAFLNEEERRSVQRRAKKEYTKTQGEMLFADISFAYNEIERISRKKIFVPANKRAFQELELIVNEVTEKSRAKLDYSNRYGEEYIPKKADLHADEELATAALYLCLIDGKSSCVLTADSDLYRIVSNMFWIFTRGELILREEQPTYALKTSPIKVYFQVGSSLLKELINTSKFSNSYFNDRPRLLNRLRDVQSNLSLQENFLRRE